MFHVKDRFCINTEALVFCQKVREGKFLGKFVHRKIVK